MQKRLSFPLLPSLCTLIMLSACAAPLLQGQQGQSTSAQPTPAIDLPPTATTQAAAQSTPSQGDDASLLPTATPTAEGQAPAQTVITATAASEVQALAVPAEDEASKQLKVPAGFAIRIFAQDLKDPRLMDVGDDGSLYVAERGANSIVRLPDANGDGLADERQVVAQGLNEPHSVEWFQNSLIVAENDKVERFTDTNGDGDMLDEGEQQVITEQIPTGGGHSSRTAHVGPDGKLYTAAGSSTNNNPESDPRRAAISRFNLDGTVPEDNPYVNDIDERRHVVWAEGLRNSVDFLFLPDGRLWADHNGSDDLGNDVPPEEIVIQVEKGKHYGWPFCYTPTLGATPPNTQEVRDKRVKMSDVFTSCAQATPALFTDLAHQAPLGIAYYDVIGFPEGYRNNLFVAYHGSWNSSTPRDCKVQMIVVQDGQPVESQPFVTGFRNSDSQSCAGAWGRPAGVAVSPKGELFISDDENGNIYRVVYVGVD
ncbi:MAG: PQQ-dependent sugar dehydrogenase [Caldilineaceae bacterium]